MEKEKSAIDAAREALAASVKSVKDSDLRAEYTLTTHKVCLPEPDVKEGESTAAAYKRLFMTGINNFMAIGFMPDAKMIDDLSKLSEQQFVKVCNEAYATLSDSIGKQAEKAQVFYKSFPMQVLSMDETEMLFNQILSYFGTALLGESYIPESAQEDPERAALMESFKRDYKPLASATRDDVSKFYSDIAKSPSSTTKERLHSAFASALTDIKNGRDCWLKTTSTDKIPNKENAAYLSKLAMALNGKDLPRKNLVSLLGRTLPTATDVLRFAAELSDGRPAKFTVDRKKQQWQKHSRVTVDSTIRKDFPIHNDPGLAGNVMFKLTTSEKNVIRDVLATRPSLYTEMWMRPELFKKLARTVPMKSGRNAVVPKRLEEAFNRLCQGNAIDERGNAVLTPYARIERALEAFAKKGDLAVVNKAAHDFPGIFSRNFFRFIDEANAKNVEELCRIYRENCKSVPVREQLKLANVIETQPYKDERYIFMSKANKYTAAPVSKIRKKTQNPEEIAAAIRNTAADKFAGQAPMGKVYLAPGAEKILLPENGARTASKGVPMPTGSRFKMQEGADVIRPFVWWTNIGKGEYGEERVDIDLSATFLNKDFESINGCSYHHQDVYVRDLERGHGNNSYGFRNHSLANGNTTHVAVHSGDITNGGHVDGNGASEYIDIDVKTLEECKKVKYVAFTIHSFTSNPFKDMEHAKFGLMQREGSVKELGKYDNEFKYNGKIYEASTVDFAFDLCGDSNSETAIVYDVENREFIWVDRAFELRGIVNAANEEQRARMAAELNKVVNPDTPTLGDLVRANVEGRSDDGVTEFVTDPSQADVVFASTPTEASKLQLKPEAKVYTCLDMDAIGAEFIDPAPVTENKDVKAPTIDDEVINDAVDEAASEEPSYDDDGEEEL